MKLLTKKHIADFNDHLIAEEKSEATVEKYLRDVRAFSQWLGDEKICKQKVLDYKKEIIKKYAPASVNSMIASLNSFFDYHNRFELKLKFLKIQREIFSNKNKEITKDEYKRLLMVAKRRNNLRLYYIMQTICSCGIRVSELKYITCEAVRCRQARINCKGKIRTVMLPPKLCSALTKYINERNIKSGSVFVTKNGKSLDRSNIWRDMKKICEDAGVIVSKVFPHNLRHLFARTFYSLEKDIVRLSDILGHSSINTTRIYTAESGEEHCRQMQKLGLLLC